MLKMTKSAKHSLKWSRFGTCSSAKDYFSQFSTQLISKRLTTVFSLKRTKNKYTITSLHLGLIAYQEAFSLAANLPKAQELLINRLRVSKAANKRGIAQLKKREVSYHLPRSQKKRWSLHKAPLFQQLLRMLKNKVKKWRICTKETRFNQRCKRLKSIKKFPRKPSYKVQRRIFPCRAPSLFNYHRSRVTSTNLLLLRCHLKSQ